MKNMKEALASLKNSVSMLETICAENEDYAENDPGNYDTGGDEGMEGDYAAKKASPQIGEKKALIAAMMKKKGMA